MTGKVLSIPALRSSIRTQIKQLDTEFEAHVKKYHCVSDSAGCDERLTFQVKLEILRDILKQIGGREPA